LILSTTNTFVLRGTGSNIVAFIGGAVSLFGLSAVLTAQAGVQGEKIVGSAWSKQNAPKTVHAL